MKLFLPAALAALVSIATTTSAQIVALQEKTTIQPSLALTYSVDSNAFVHIFASNFAPEGTALANGQLLSIADNLSLFNLVGTTYGGDGLTTFAVPNLNGRVAVGAGTGPGLIPTNLGDTSGTENVFLSSNQFPSGLPGTNLDQPFTNLQPSLGLNYIVAEQGIFPVRPGSGGGTGVPFLGEIALFAGTVAPRGWHFADGTILSIASNTALFSLLGTTYGGNGFSTFALPDLRGRVAVDAGSGPGLTPRTLGESFGTDSTQLTNLNIPTVLGGPGLPYDNMQPSLAVNFMIAPQGVFPSRDSGPTAPAPDPSPFISELLMFGGDFVPAGFAPTNGSLLTISSNTALFSLLGTQFGGNGFSTFALPDLRGRTGIGAGNGGIGLSPYEVGDSVGVESVFLDATAPVIEPPPVTAVPEPATFIYVALFGAVFFVRRLFAAKKSNS